MKIGYIGLGLMGTPCVQNLLKSGFEVHIWARRPQSMQPLVELGAKPCESIVDLASTVDILFTNVSDTPDVEEILLGKHGVIISKHKGLIVIDMSTISAIATRKMAQALAQEDIELVDAPVSGGTAGAEAGTLTVMVGASESTFERIKPVLAAVGKSITRIGPVGAGQVAKSCNQIIITGTIAAVAEAFKFASAQNVDFAPIREALLGGFAKSTILKMHAKRMLEHNYAPGFKTTLHAKDMHIVEKIAKELALHMPVSEIGVELLDKTVAAGFADQDSSAMAEVIKKL